MQRLNRSRFDATVESNRLICREHFRLRLQLEGRFPETQPGQFVQLRCHTPNRSCQFDSLFPSAHNLEPGQRITLKSQELRQAVALLRRPFSIADRGDNQRGAWIDVIHRVVGVGTAWLANLQPGDPIDLIGPLGHGFTFPEGKTTGLLVGGGVGLPPMFYLAQVMHRLGWDAVGFVGAMTADLLAITFDDDHRPDSDAMPNLSVCEYSRYGFHSVVTTDDGSTGFHGQITDGLARYMDVQPKNVTKRTVVYTCGPGPMMNAVAQVAHSYGVDCQVCLEQTMACGMGTCQSCVVKIATPDSRKPITAEDQSWQYRLVCRDGPVFDAGIVVW